MRTGKLARHGAMIALIAAGAAALSVTPASARLVCNQYGSCHWTQNGYVPSRYENRQYENEWNVRIHGAGHHNNRYDNRDRNNDYNRDRHDYDHDGDRGYQH